MKLSLNWLKMFAPQLNDLSESIAKRLTSLGIEVEAIENQGGSFTNVVVGKIISLSKHPNADKLSLCKVDVGLKSPDGNPLSIVCGAQNVGEGQTVAVALVGAELKMKSGEVIKIKKSKIRGELSEGMICAEDELGLSDNHDGILILPPTYEIGEPFETYLQSDTIFDISITPNRPDWLSHQGVARELVGHINLNKQNAAPLSYQDNDTHLLIEDKVGCPHYIAVLIEGVKVSASPKWLQDLLKAVGIRPINNIVDITNYVLHAIGQPLHAFDADLISDNQLGVRSTYKGEFRTLDGKVREIVPGMMMIYDSNKPVAIAGVMGGLDTEITLETTDVLLESAYFDPSSIRKTSKHLGLVTDASYRFERGVDPLQLRYAAELASALIIELAGGFIRRAAESQSRIVALKKIDLRPSRINEILGTNIHTKKVNALLEHIGISKLKEVEDKLTYLIPSFRVDMNEEIDLIEEIARVYGYDNIPPAEKLLTSYPKQFDRLASFDDQLREVMIGMGFKEVLTNPLLPLQDVSMISKHPIRTLNPVSEEMDSLRPSMLPSMLKIVSHNLNRGNLDMRLFEVAHTFKKTIDDEHFSDDRGSYISGYVERNKLGVIMTGGRSPKNWNSSNEPVDFYDLKGVIEMLLKRIHCFDKSKFVAYTQERLCVEIQLVHSDKLSSDMGINGTKSNTLRHFVGFLESVSMDVLKRFDIDQPVFFAELDVLALKSFTNTSIRYQEPAKFPSVLRDLAFYVPIGVKASEMIDAILETNHLINDVIVFDVYEPKIAIQSVQSDGKRSIAFSLKLVSYERTMTDEEIVSLTTTVVQRLHSKFGAELRQA